MRYVCGLAIHDGTHVVMSLKERPPFLAGFYSGVCGTVDRKKKDVSATIAMIREFKDSTGVDTDIDDWEIVGNLFIGNDIIHYFKYDIPSDKFNALKNLSDELVVKLTIPNALDTLFPLEKYTRLFLSGALDSTIESMNITIK